MKALLISALLLPALLYSQSEIVLSEQIDTIEFGFINDSARYESYSIKTYESHLLEAYESQLLEHYKEIQKNQSNINLSELKNLTFTHKLMVSIFDSKTIYYSIISKPSLPYCFSIGVSFKKNVDAEGRAYYILSK